MKIGIIGFGSVGRQLYGFLLETGYLREDIAVFDDNYPPDGSNFFKFNDYQNPDHKKLCFIPALGYLSKNVRYKILNFLVAEKFEIFSFIHPRAFVSKNAVVGRGVIIYPLCNIDQGTTIHDGSIILNSSIVAHDSVVGSCTYISPGVCINGLVEIGELCFIGSGSVIVNNIHVGANSTIGAGTCLTKSIPENSFAIGNPFSLKGHIKLT
jgi:sugar O-acyltransferase (sialic acid O-acetyltransferase NeuD family)